MSQIDWQVSLLPEADQRASLEAGRQRLIDEECKMDEITWLANLTTAPGARSVVPSFKCDDAHNLPWITFLWVGPECIHTHPQQVGCEPVAINLKRWILALQECSRPFQRLL